MEDENEVLGADAEAGTGTEPENASGTEAAEAAGEATEIVIDTSQFASEVAVLEGKLEVLTGQAAVLTEKVTGCYCMLLILAVLGVRKVFRGIIRKIRGGIEDV